MSKDTCFLSYHSRFFLSFFRGKSRCCERPIPIIYFLMELVTPIYILLLYIQFSFSYSFLLYYIIYFFSFFFITDIFYLYVPNSILIVFFCVLAIIAILYNQTLMDFIFSGVISCLFYLLFLLFFEKELDLAISKYLLF